MQQVGRILISRDDVLRAAGACVLYGNLADAKAELVPSHIDGAHEDVRVSFVVDGYALTSVFSSAFGEGVDVEVDEQSLVTAINAGHVAVQVLQDVPVPEGPRRQRMRSEANGLL
jgi:hypothetical protein